MFDFIKRLFHGKKKPQDVDSLDVVEGNDIEILKTSDYSEGAPADAVERLVAEQELPPPELDLPMLDSEIPAAELDEPSDEPDVMAEEDAPDNYMLGELDHARKQRAMQTSKAGMQYWNDGVMKYKPRSQRHSVDGTNAKNFNYFDVLREEPMLRQVELQRPGMSIDQLNLQRYVESSLKGKMVSEYVRRSMRLIRDQKENGVVPIWKNDCSTAGGSEVRDADNTYLRDLFNAYEAQSQNELVQENNSVIDSFENQGIDATEEVDELLHHFEELFEETEQEDNNESYTRWLMSVAEEGTASPDILWLLVEDPNPDVRFCLAEHYDIDTDMLKVLSEDDNPYVAHRAQKTLIRLQSPAGRVVDREFGNGEINRFRKSG